MSRLLIALALLLCATGAEAGFDIKKHHPSAPPNPITQAMGRPDTIAALGLWYGAGVAWCAGSAPILATIILRRPLTRRELFETLASCVIPVLGGMIAHKLMANHPEIDVIQPWELEAMKRDRFGIGSQS